VLYGNTAIALVVTPASYGNLGAAGLVETSGQAAVGSAIDAVRPAAGATMTANQAAFYAPLYGLPAAIIPAALDQLGPSIYGDALMTARDGWYTVTDTIGRHMDASRSSVPVGQHQVWVTSLGDFSNTGASGGLGYTGTTAGVVAGVDMRPHENWSAGVALGYLNLQTGNTAAAQMSGDSLSALLYGGWQQGVLFVDGQAGGFAMEGNSQRALGAWGLQARGDTNGHGAGGTVRIGMTLPYADWLIQPSVQVGGVSLSQGALTENQGGVLALSVGRIGLASVQSLAGVSASKQYTLPNGAILVPSARIGWAHEYADQNASVTAALAGVQSAGFTVSTPNTGRDAAIAGIGAELQLASQLSLHVDYRGAFRSNSNAQQISGGLRYVW
jgi:outer membrane autotransporter protein